MLQIRLCTDRKINQRRLLEELRDCAQRKEAGHILIVPEQFSHMTERLLCEYVGDRIGQYAEVLSFSRLANRVFSVEGGVADTQTDASGRLLMMSLAVEQVRSRLKIYGSSVTKPEFLLHLLDMFDEFRSYCITSERLRKAAELLSGTLAVKMEEFAILMESFDAVSANLGQNPESRLTRLLTALETGHYAEGKSFWFDGFTDFNGVEREIIAELLHQSASVTVLLQCDDLTKGRQQFDAARDTAKALLHITTELGLDAQVLTLPAGDENEPLSYLRRHIFGGKLSPYPHRQEAIRFLHPSDRESECLKIASEILRLVSEGARWRDISVACADFAAYRPSLESVFRRYDIPAYFAGDTDILRQPVVRMLLSALKAATGGMEQEDVLNYLKSGLTPLSREACDRMENYVVLWSISGSRWGREWTMHPDGIKEDFSLHAQRKLEQLNDDRTLAITPLLRLRSSLASAENTGEMVRSLYEFTETIGLSDRIAVLADESRSAGDPQAEQECVQVYAIVTELLEQMYGVLGQSVREPESFARIFRAAISRCSIGTIPASLDCVTVGSLMSQRRCDTPYVFLIGAQEGSLPAVKMQKSLLTDSERVDLNQQGIEIAPTTAGNLNRELACIDSVLNAPTKRLYLSAAAGAEAYLMKRAAELFPHADAANDPSVCRSERAYLAQLVRTSELPEEGNLLRGQAERLIAAKDYTIGSLNGETVDALYGKTLHLSASKIDTLAGCRLAFFLSYGLKLNANEPAQFNALEFGNFIHDVLEHTGKQVQQEGGFHKVPLERVQEIAEKRMTEYAEKHLSDVLETERAAYLFKRSFAEVHAVVADLYRELSRSDFEPKWFELNFSENGTLPAIRIKGEKSVAEIEGRVDRADVWQKDDKLFVRVIDYKSGKMTFDLTKVLNGLGLQMLLYLFALRRTGDRLCGCEPEPAGVFYFSAKAGTASIDDKYDNDGLEKIRRIEKKRSGLALYSDDVLQAMEHYEEKPEYMPSPADKKTERAAYLCSLEQLKQLEDYVFDCVGQLGDLLYCGNIAAEPYFINDKINACSFCDYKAVCRASKRERWLRSVKDEAEFWQSIGKEAEGNG